MAAYDAWGDSWGPAGAGAWGVSWYHTDADDTTDTHDGFDKERKKRDSDYRSRRERLRETLTQAWDGPGPVAAELKALASPFVEILESGALRIDEAAIQARHAAVMDEVLALQAAMRAEYQAARDDEDEDDIVLLTWS